MPNNLQYDTSSFAGPVDPQVVSFLEENKHSLDRSYLAHAEQFHGGIPGKQYFTSQTGMTYRVGRFLTLLDGNSQLQPPHCPSWEFPPRDIRIDRSVATLLDEESQACTTLFDELVPFAALYAGPNHPDQMSLSRGHCNLLAFSYIPAAPRPRIVVWLAAKALEEYYRWEKNDFDAVHYHEFTNPVADNFDEFLELLRAAP